MTSNKEYRMTARIPFKWRKELYELTFEEPRDGKKVFRISMTLPNGMVIQRSCEPRSYDAYKNMHKKLTAALDGRELILEGEGIISVHYNKELNKWSINCTPPYGSHRFMF